MLLPFDQPFIGKLTLHGRSKTTSVLKYKQKKNSVSLNSKKLYSNKLNYKSTATINHNTQPTNDPININNFRSLRSMTEQIQRLINKEMCYPQLLTYVERNSSRLRTIDNENPEGREFDDTFYVQKNQKNIQTCTSGFREPQYLTLLRKTQRLNTKAFVPHFNWKQKLSRMKNLGNYGNVYKKSEKPSEKKFAPRIEPQKQRIDYVKDYVIDSTKIILDPQIVISRGLGFQQAKKHKKMSPCKRCHTSCSEYPNEIERRHNQTLVIGERLVHLRKLSQTKPMIQEKTQQKGKHSERDWKFQPWDVRKDN